MSNSKPSPCPDWERWLPLTHPADLSPEQRDALEAHLATCSACAVVRADYQRMDARIRAWPSGRPREGLPPALVQLWTEKRQRPVHGRRRLSSSMEKGMRTHEEQPISLPSPSTQPRPLRLLVSGVSAVAAVAVIAILLTALVFSHSAKPSTPASSPAPTTSTSSQDWQKVSHLTNLPGVPVLAPSNPQVVYEAQMAGTNLPTTVTLQRSDDGGATWHTLSVPAGITQVYTVTLLASPLSAQSVFIQFVAKCSTAQANTTALALAPYSGSANSCISMYLSTDGGAHWSLIHLPTHQTGSNPYLSTVAHNDIQAQGNRLYALIYDNAQDGNSFDTSFVSSTDGGATWQFADQSLVKQGNCVADYTVIPTGSTVFATTADKCDPASRGVAAMNSLAVPLSGGAVNYSLWRSDDAGAQWTKVGPTPDGSTGLTLSLDSAGQPVLFFAPYTPTPGRGGSAIPTIAAQVSMDGGKTWQEAPALDGQTTTSGILGTLSNGSIIVSFTDTKTQKNRLFTWKPGDAAWQQLAGNFQGTPQYLLVLPAGNGQQTLWLVTQADANQAGNYTVQRLTV